MVERFHSFTEHLVDFARTLRKHGFPLGIEQVQEVVESLKWQFPQNKEQYQLLLKVCFVKSRDQDDLFDDLFNEYWRQYTRGKDAKIKKEQEEGMSKSSQPSLEQIKSWLYQHDTEEREIALTGLGLGEETAQLSITPESKVNTTLIEQLLQLLQPKQSRRFTKHLSGSRLNLKGIVSDNWQYDGDWIELSYERRKLKNRKFVLLLDVSRSMELHHLNQIQLAHHLDNMNIEVEVFIFGISLEKVSWQIKIPELKTAIERVTKSTKQWSAGTRIGHSLQQFIRENSILLKKSTTIAIISDGWETGNIDEFVASINTLKRRCHEVIWIHPGKLPNGEKQQVRAIEYIHNQLEHIYPLI